MINWKVLWDSFYTQVFKLDGYKTILEGLTNTLIIAIVGFIIGIIVGSLIAIMQLLPDSKTSKVLNAVAKVYVGIFRGTPILVQLLVGWFVIKPVLGISNANAVAWATVIYGLNSSAYASEIIRGGILSVDKGQTEAGRSLGLPYSKTMIKIVIPQALKNSIPAIGNELISLVKETSVAGLMSVTDLQVAFKLQDTLYTPIICYLALAVVYIILVVLFTLIVKLIERRLRTSDKR